MNSSALLIAIAVVELLTGIGLLLAPSLVVEILLGQGLGPVFLLSWLVWQEQP